MIDPRSLDDYRAHGGYKGLARALALGPEAIIEEVTAVGPARPRRRRLPDRHQVEDRGADASADQKYIVCNADEGDSGTFADRMIMEGDPFVLIEGMTIAGIAVGATKGYIYIRSEYPHAVAAMDAAIASGAARAAISARSVGGSAHAFDLEVRVGAGAYVCGEETSLLESLEGRRGHRARQAAAAGAQGPVRQADRDQQRAVVRRGAHHPGRGRRRSTAISAWAARAAPCRSSSPATSSMAACSRPPSASRSANWSTTSAAARCTGRPVRAVQVGGPLGAYFPRALFDTPFDYEAFAARDGLIGHGGIVVFDDTVDMAQAGALRHGVLRHRILRQVHALPASARPAASRPSTGSRAGERRRQHRRAAKTSATP